MILYISLTINAILLFLWIKTLKEGVKLAFKYEELFDAAKAYRESIKAKQWESNTK